MPSPHTHTDHTHPDLPGRILAFLVFLLGIGLLCLVFGLAWSLFRSPVPGLELPVRAGQAAPPAAGIGLALTAFVRQLLLLALMTVAGSLISGKGVQLYYSAAHRQEPQQVSPAASPNHHAKPDVAAVPAESPAKSPPA